MTVSKKTLFNFFVALMCVNCVSGQLLYVDDPCRTNSGQRGACRLECPVAIRLQRVSGIRATLCGFEGNRPVVCCPYSSELTSTTAAPNINNNWANNISFNPKQPTRPTPNPRPRPTSNSGRNERISAQMCKRYSSSVQQNFEVLPLLPDPEPLTITVPKCVHSSTPLIVGGTEAQIGEFPHMTAIGYNDPNGGIAYFCGGTLISDRFVLTAAHCCVSRAYGSPVTVRLGDHDLERNDDGLTPEEVPVSQVILHPSYVGNSKYNDIALLRLQNSVAFSNTIRPACLWLNDEFNQDNAVATGWGQTSFGSSDKPSALQKVELSIVRNSECAALPAYAPAKRLIRGIVEEQMCAGDVKNGGKDACLGDSGGPLQITNTENRCIFYLIGVTSFGKGCAHKGTPGIYTRVSSYLDWIEKTVWPQ